MVCCKLRGSSSKSMGIHIIWSMSLCIKNPCGKDGVEKHGEVLRIKIRHTLAILSRRIDVRKSAYIHIEAERGRERENEIERERVRQTLRNQKCQQA